MMSLYGDQCGERVKALLSGLRAKGVDVVVLKGWAFIQTIYAGDHSVRYCEDIDILVLPQETSMAVSVLTQMGYQSKAETWPGRSPAFS